MTPTPVGMRCPECSRERTKVRTARTLSASSGYSAWQILIAINVVVFVAELATGVTGGGSDSGWVYDHGLLLGPLLTAHNHFGPPLNGDHQYWRLLTSGFLHASLIHIALNMLSLYFVGRSLEPAIGRVNFAAIYFASLLAGSFGALWFTPLGPEVGASGAIFGVFGALVMIARARGISLWATGLAPVLLINLVFDLSDSSISLGGHIGGFVAGLICGGLVVELHERRGKQGLALAGCAAVGVISVIAALAVAGGHGIAPNGVTL
jgi:membrane associated rhomboid family serine protease